MTLLVCVLLTAGLASSQEATTTALTTEMTGTELSTDFETTSVTGGTISSSKPSIVEPALPCDRDWSTRDFLLEHPGFPLEYPNGVLCRYSVRRHSPSVCGLEITFRKFELERSPGCEADFFAVGDERLCGRIPAQSVVQSTFDEDSDAIAMTFGTDANGTRSGFQIFFRQIAHCEDDLNSIPAVHACDVLITDISGELVTRRYPSDSLGDPVCRYTVGRRHSGYCQVELDFVDFEVDYSPGCVHSYVELDAHRFCGTSLRGHKKNVTFDTMGNVHIVYKTDTVRMDRGFHLLFRQLPCPAESPVRSPGGTELVNERLPMSGCSRVYSEREFYLESPGFPNYYPDGLDCRLVVRRFRPTVCRLDVRFLDFDVEESPGCVYDFLQLDSQRLCGLIPEDNVKTMPFLSYEKVLRFKTDSVNPRPGFFLYVRQLDCGLQPTSACDQHLWDREARLASPNYPRDYDNNLRCRYTVHREGEHICRLEVTFLDLEVQNGSPGCYHDFLEMDGGFRACGNAFQGVTRSLEFAGPEQVLFFSSDAWSTGRGFLLALRQVPCAEAAAPSPAPDDCDRRLEAPSFALRSPLGYPPNLACRYLIRKASPSVCQLRFRFAHFDLESSPGCSRDYLALDGQRLCGSLLPNTTRTFRFDGPELVVLFRSDSAVQASGFEAAVDQVECGPAPIAPAGGAYCSRQLTELRSSVSSPNYPSPYPPSTACRYSFRLQPGHCALELHFADFALEHSPTCARDYLELAGHRYCGQQLRGLSKVEPGPEVVMRFVSDGLVSDKGFLASFRQVPCGEARGSPSESSSVPCGGDLWGPSFDVRWPELAPDYGQSASCEWTVHRLGPDTCALRITFAELELADCARHFVQVDGDTLCGRLPPYTVREYSFSGPLLLIRATSAQLPRPRVLLQAQQVPCGAAAPPPPASCDRTLAGAEFEVSSFGPSAGALDCRYVVRKASPLACRLELVLERFELPGGCLDAHLRVDADDRLCGNLAPYSVRLYDFGSSEKLIHFRAARLPPGAGFLVRGRQLPCTSPPAPVVDAPAASSSRRCDQSFGVEEFSLRSPGRPAPYPPDLLCRFVVIRAGPHVCGLQVAFEAFELEDSYQCRRDYLEVDGERLCGLLPPGSVRDYAFHPADRTKVLTFRSDYANGRQGFALRVRQTRVCPSTVPSLLPAGGGESVCGSQYVSSPRGSVSSPGFPGGYPAGQCLLTFLQLRGFCSVRLRFRDFDLAPAADCLADHLELEPGRRHCDGQLFQATRELFFPWSNSSTLSLLFHSERGSVAHRGYSADFEQVPCRRQARELDAAPTAPSSQADRDEDWDDSRTTPKNSTVEYAP